MTLVGISNVLTYNSHVSVEFVHSGKCQRDNKDFVHYNIRLRETLVYIPHWNLLEGWMNECKVVSKCTSE